MTTTTTQTTTTAAAAGDDLMRPRCSPDDIGVIRRKAKWGQESARPVVIYEADMLVRVLDELDRRGEKLRHMERVGELPPDLEPVTVPASKQREDRDTLRAYSDSITAPAEGGSGEGGGVCSSS